MPGCRRPSLAVTAVTAAATTVTTLAAAVPTSAAPTSAVPTSAAHSAAQRADQKQRVPRAVSLVGTELRLADGQVVDLAWAAGSHPVLLGTGRRGWVVAAGAAFRLVRPDGRVSKIASRDRVDPEVSEGLFDNGRRIVSTAIDQAGALTINAFDLKGRVVHDSWYSSLPGDVMDAAGGTLYVGGPSGLRALDEETGTRVRLERRPTGLVDRGRDTIFVGSRKQPWRVGPTSLATPGTPRWRARFDPIALSPDGRYVVGREGNGGVVRAMRDGRVVRRVPARETAGYRFLGWASSHRVLFEARAGKRETLVSCAVPRGACRRVGSTRGEVSLPTSHAGPYRQP